LKFFDEHVNMLESNPKFTLKIMRFHHYLGWEVLNSSIQGHAAALETKLIHNSTKLGRDDW
jgi:hypothetical protein